MSNDIAVEHYGTQRPQLGSQLVVGRPSLASDADHPDTTVRYVDGHTWDSFAAGFADTVNEQSSCFVESRWGPGRIERVVIEQAGEQISGATVVLFRVPTTDRGLAIVKWGPVWRKLGAAPDTAHLSAALSALVEEFVNERSFVLSVLPSADPDYSELTVAALQQLGFGEGSSLPYPDRYLVNVAQTPDELRASLDQKWRYNLKKSLKNDLDVRFVDAEEGYPVFMDLYGEMLGRKQFQDSSAIATLADMIESPVPEHKPVFVLVNHEGRPTAGAVLSVSGERAVYLYGATDRRALRLKAGYAMHWWIAEWLCGLPDSRWYDLGGTDGDTGLHQFKKGFCGKTGVIVTTPPTYTRSRSHIDHLIGRSIYLARDLKAATSRTLHRVRTLLPA